MSSSQFSRPFTLFLLFISTIIAQAQNPVITSPALTPYDVSSFSYSGALEEFYVGGQETGMDGMAFSADGTKMFIIGDGNDNIFEYALSAAFDVSTAVYTGSSEDFEVRDEESSATGLAFNDVGTKMFVIGYSDDAVVEYTLSTAYDVSTAVYAGSSEEFDVSNEEVAPYDIDFNADGTKMFILGGADDSVIEYSLSVAFDVSTASYTTEFDVTNEDTTPRSMTFSADGSQMFVVGSIDDAIVGYELSTPYDVSTAVHTGESKELFTWFGDTYVIDFAFNLDGTKLFLAGSTDDVIVEYELSSFVSYAENSTAAVIDIDANDGSGGTTDASVTYTLEGTDADLFSVNAAGEISFLSSPNYEEPQDEDVNNVYKIIVVADNSTNQVRLNIEVTVTNVIDSPIFTNAGQGFDVSTAIYTGIQKELYVGFEDIEPRGITFNDDGTKMFVTGSKDDAIVEYDLLIAFDVSTAIYAGEAEDFYVGDRDTSPYKIVFNNDGTKMFMVGSANDSVFEYALGTAYDVSTASYVQDFVVQNEEGAALGISFNSDGTKMFIVGNVDDAIVEYSLGTAYDISTAIYAGESEELYVGGKELSPTSVTFNTNGTKMYVSGTIDDDIYEYDLSIGYDVSTAIYASELYYGDKETASYDFVFNPDGTKMYIIGAESLSILEYALATTINYTENGTGPVIDIDANDGLGGATDASVSYTLAGIDATLFSINATGEISFISSPDHEDPQDDNADNVYEITVVAANSIEQSRQNIQITVVGDIEPIFTYVGEGYDISTAVYAGISEELYVGTSEATPRSLTFNADGSKMFIIGTTGEAVIEYLLEINYDISTAAYSRTFSVEPEESNPLDVTFNSDGTKMFVMGSDDDAVVEYNLLTAYELSTAVYSGEFDFGSEETSPYGLAFNTDGSKMFIIGSATDAVLEYDLSTAYDVSTAAYAGETEEFYVGNQEATPQSLVFSADGTSMYTIGVNDKVIMYKLETSYDVSTATYAGSETDFSVASEESIPHGMNFNNAGTSMFIIGSDDASIVEYKLSSIVNFDENSSSAVIDVDANDGQGGATDTSITYDLEGEDSGLFTIDATGVISFISSPDYETPLDSDVDNIYQVTISIINGLESASQPMLITVADVDEVAPTITSATSVSVEENVTGSVYTAAADEEATFSLGATKDENLFILSTNTISFINAPDFEIPEDGNADNEYLLDLTATDIAGNSSTIQVAITVTNIEDETAPVITSASSLSVEENVTGTIYTATADEEVTFTLGETKDEALFTLSGDEVGFINAPDYETPLDLDEDNVYLIDLIAADEAGNATTLEVAITVTDFPGASQEITFGTLSTKTYGDASFALTATASSGLTVTYASSDETIATVAGSTVTILQAGSTTITASQGGNEEYDAASDVTQELVVSKATLNVIADDKTITYGEALPEFTLTYEDFIGDDDTDDLTTLPTATTTAVAGSDAGEYTIQVEGGSATSYDFTYETGTLTITKADQTITFAEISDVDIADGNTVNLTATASSGLEVSYEITQGSDIASESEGVVTLTGTGTVTIEASQAGNTNYDEVSTTQSFNVTDSRRTDQTITFTSLDSKIYGDASFGLTATASSGLTVTYSSSNETIATISGSTVTIVGVGATTITASQDGDDDFNPATQVTQDLTVSKASLTITADDQEMTVGETLPELTMSFTGFVNNEGAEDITPPSISTTATGETVGAFEIELSDDGSADNYELTLVNGTLTVNEEEVLSVITANAIMVYPNPVSDWLTIADKQVNKVEVYSLEGSLVQAKSITSGKVNISELQEGTYVLKLLDEGGELLSTNRLLKR